jgi:beta-carotene hydroxylase
MRETMAANEPPAGGAADRPTLAELGADLLEMSPLFRAFTLAMPFLATGLVFFLLARGWWWLAAPAVGVQTFCTYASVSHDLVHGTLRLGARTNDVLLALVELLGLRSGHAYRATHLFHHRRFPALEDLEGAPARMPLARVLLEGPVYLLRLGAWAWRQARPHERAWMAAEAAGITGYLGAALFLWLSGRTPLPALYALLVVPASWAFPLVFVYLMHDAAPASELFQTRAFRGRLVPALMLHHTYHLEHHLYPSVPARNWRALGRRLDPLLARAGVVPVRLP